MTLAHGLKRAFRTYVYADGRYSPDIMRRYRSGFLTARYLDDGAYPVIRTTSARCAPVGIANHIGRLMKHEPALFLVWFSWTMEGPNAVRWLATAVSAYLHRRPRHRVILLCNTEAEERAFKAAGVDAILCNHNAFVDEGVFYPLAERNVHFEAVYNAVMLPWKRRELSRLVGRCAHITYGRTDYENTMALLAEMRALMPAHTFVNPVVDGVIHKILPTEVNAVLAQSRVGLCLSAAEGAMLASMEYLLAGLPVVSTPSFGGREAFADPEYWLTVEDRPESVRDGVAEMIARGIDRERVRARTLEKIHEHRLRLRTAVAGATDGQVLLPEDLAHPLYRERVVWRAGDDLASALTKSRPHLASHSHKA